MKKITALSLFILLFTSVSANGEIRQTNYKDLSVPSECKISSLHKDSSYLDSSKSVKGIVISVDFKNYRSEISAKDNALQYIKESERFFKENSYNKFNISIDYLDQWISLPETPEFYSNEKLYSQDIIDYTKLVISESDKYINFSTYDIVYIVVDDSTRNFFETGPVVAFKNDSIFYSEEGIIKNIAVGTDPYLGMGGSKWRWLAHETGHMIGLGHPHSYENDDERLASIFSLMDFGWVAPGFYSFERWMLNWITDEQVRCIEYTPGTTYHKINSIHGPDSFGKAGVIKISENELIFFESRRREGMDRMPKKYEGLFVYHLKDGLATPIINDNYLVDYSMPSHNGDRVVGTLRNKESVYYKNIKITNLKLSRFHDFVEVEIK